LEAIMTQLVALDSRTHRDVRVVPRPGRECVEINAVSVIPREFPRLLAHYPVFFTKSPESGRFEPAALLGFRQQENLFFVNGQWDVAYVPLQIQRQPFSLLPRRGDPARGTQDSLDVALDLESPQIQTQEGERLFLEDGAPSKFLQNITSMLSALVSGSTEAYAFTARLSELNLLEPVQIEIEFVDRSQTKLQGLYWIAAAALKALPPAPLAGLRDRGYLEWLYFQMASIAHVSSLVARKNQLLSGVTTTPTS
jgi:SapC